MKKIVVLLAAVLSLGISVNSYAAAVGTAWLQNNGGTVVIPAADHPTSTLTIKPSANVFLGWGVDASGTAYVLLSTHATGSFAYGTSSGDTNIFRLPTVNTVANANTITATLSGGSLPAVPAANTAADWTGWTASK